MPRSEHSKLHNSQRDIKKVNLTCMQCGKKFERREKLYLWKLNHGQQVVLCSKRCSGLRNKNSLEYAKYEGTSKYADIIENGLKENLSGYAIAKKFSLNTTTVYNYLRKKICLYSSVVEHSLCKRRVGGTNPFRGLAHCRIIVCSPGS